MWLTGTAYEEMHAALLCLISLDGIQNKEGCTFCFYYKNNESLLLNIRRFVRDGLQIAYQSLGISYDVRRQAKSTR